MKTCRFCGMKSHRWIIRDSGGWACENERTCFNRVWAMLEGSRAKAKRLLEVGGLMSNCCFNLGQDCNVGAVLTADWVKTLRDLRARWDAEIRR